jgi:glyoxylase-like metal-dependent hydrolase (beta-lactamase superfamily II)
MDDIVPGVTATIAPGIVRITAPNPSVMTGPGTNSYIVGDRELVLIDPGPDIESHAKALISAVGDRLKWIICTHTHVDHSPAAQAVKAATGAPIAGAVCPQDGRQDTQFAPDRVLSEGDTISVQGVTLRAIHTPGHVCNHLCYLFQDRKVLFTGDHVMQGSTVVITPPNGSMRDYFASIDKLLTLDIVELMPGHGRVIRTAHDEVRKLIAHRLKREQKVLDALKRKRSGSVDELVPFAYDDVSERLYPVARRSLHAHLIKLAQDGKARESGESWEIVA